MNDNNDQNASLAALRRRAEEKTGGAVVDPLDIAELSEAQISALIHELDVQRVELEMQNEELRKTQVELELARDRYSALFTFAPVAYFILDPKGRIQQANQVGAHLLGVRSNELTGRQMHEFIAKGDQDRFFRHLRQGFGEQGRERFELEIRRDDDTAIRTLTEGVAQRDAEQRVSQCLVVMLDITDRIRAEQALQAADRRKDEFLAILAHELRNPLAPLSNALQVLNERDQSEGAHQQARDMMSRQLHHMVRLIDDLLDVSRIAGGSLRLRREPVDLLELLGQVVEEVLPQMEQAGHRLDVSLPREPLMVDADLVRLTQIFVNLLNNARTYTEPGGRIVLAAEREGDLAVVRVRDNGAGIAPRDVPKLFERFKRLGPALDGSDYGLGIGLWLTRNLVQLHGGDIVAASEGVGRGSEFTVRLPLIAGAETGLSATTDYAEPTPGETTEWVLVVDDNRDAAASLALLLEADGRQTAIAYDGEQALDAVERFQPTAVLLDIGLPGRLDGYAVCRAMRGLPGGGDRLLVALTGWGQEEDRRKAREAGFDAHLVKPVQPKTLHSLLADYLKG